MDKIAVLDFGGQYAHLIANRIRRLGVYSEIFENNVSADTLKDFKGIILSGGPQSVYENEAPKCDEKILDLGIPILGICYGHQLLVYMQNGQVSAGKTKEYGFAELGIVHEKGILQGLNGKEIVWMSHGDTVSSLPEGYEILGSTSDCKYAAIGNDQKKFYGVQFHLEVSHTPSGMKIFENFLTICGCKREWKIENFLDFKITEIKEKIGDKKVFMLVSGGVDSTVAFALLEKAIGTDRVYGLFIDTGFLRFEERNEVENALQKLGFNNLHIKDASQDYFEALKEKYDPEEKRKIIGDLFLKIQAEVAAELKLDPNEWLLGQGTIYPDTIETGGTKNAAKIKTHHNRVPQIQALIEKGLVIEPIAELYKDEVRELGLKLGLPEKMIWRHPFPGPGLAVRTLCVTESKLPTNASSIENQMSQMFHQKNLKVKILPLQSVGVQGDFRTYRNPIAFIGASDFETLGKLATQVINQFPEVNRAVWLISHEKIETMQIHKKYLTPDRIQLLQLADKTVTDFMNSQNLSRKIWQFPTVLLPLSVNSENGESIVLRPVCSEEAMTANFYAMDLELVHLLSQKLMDIRGITAVFYDITNKPPGTIEWE